MSTGFPFPVLDGTITDTAGSGGSGGSGTGGTTGIAVTTGADILIFPNPTSNVIYISAPIALRAELHAMDGRKILEQQNAHEINLTDIAGGMYTLMLFNREGTMIRVEKVVKE
jgi:hypothetical protein